MNSLGCIEYVRDRVLEDYGDVILAGLLDQVVCDMTPDLISPEPDPEGMRQRVFELQQKEKRGEFMEDWEKKVVVMSRLAGGCRY